MIAARVRPAAAASLAPGHPVGQAATVRRAVIDRLMRAHRRYTGANGDALAGALTYATLVGAVPAAAVVSLARDALTPAEGGRGGSGRVVELAGDVLPAEVLAALASIPPSPAPAAITVVAALALPYATVRLARTLRTGVRAMAGQNAGTGNPFRDAASDARLAVAGLALAVAAVVGVAAPAGALRAACAIVACWALSATILRFAVRPGPLRPGWPAALRAAGGATAGLALLAALARGYLELTEGVHEALYGAAGALIGALVLVSLAARVVLRAASFAGTAGPGERP